MENSQQENPPLKLPKIEIFQVIQKNLTTVGITPNLSTQPYPLNGKIVMGFLILTSALISSCVYFFYFANTIVEYTQSTYMGSIAIMVIIFLLIIVFKVEKLFVLISHFDIVINTSK